MIDILNEIYQDGASYKYHFDFDRLFEKLGVDDYTFSVDEYDEHHDEFPLGYDINVDKDKKHIHLDIYLQNKIKDSDLWESIYNEIKHDFESLEDVVDTEDLYTEEDED